MIWPGALKTRAKHRRLSIPLALPILVVYLLAGILLLPSFLSPLNLTSILFSVSTLLPAVLGMQVLLILGRFDLSIGATASFAGMVSAALMVQNIPVTVALAVGLFAGCASGYLNGLFTSHMGVDPLISTLAMLGVLRSLALVVHDGRIVAGLPLGFGRLAGDEFGHFPTLIAFAALLTIAAILLSRHAVIFRRIYAVGDNSIAAAHAGVNASMIIRLGFVLAGLGASVAGLLQASRTLSASPLNFETLAIEAITACVIGGSSLAGGRGSILGATLGLIVVVSTENLVVMTGISVYWQDLAIGCLLLFALLIDPAARSLHKHAPKQAPPERTSETHDKP